MKAEVLPPVDLANLQPKTLEIDATIPAGEATQTLSAQVAETPHQTIEQAVVELLNEGRPENEKRWEPRVSFVRPVSISFKRWRWATQREFSELGFQESTFREFQTEIAAISTDISLDGIGIVAMYNALPSRVTLEVSGTVFVCKVRWSERIDIINCHYGLRFVDILDKPVFRKIKT